MQQHGHVSGQNTSTAVMARRTEPPDSLDYFPTPPWGTRALVETLLPNIRGAKVAEPACGTGDMARPLAEYAGGVAASDIFDYGFGVVADFLAGGLFSAGLAHFASDWIVTNPPFTKAEEFAARALCIAKTGVALLARVQFLEGEKRYNGLYLPTPPAFVAPFAERLPIFRGRLDPDGSSATAYAWFVWMRGQHDEPRLRWIPPCRARLERPGDYRNPLIPPVPNEAPLFDEAS